MKPKGGNKLLKRLMRGGMWVLLGRIVVAACGIAASSLLARLLTPEEFGAYFIIVSITLVASKFALFGTTQTMVKVIAGNVDRPDSVVRQVRAVWLITVLGTLVVTSLYFAYLGAWLANDLFESSLVAGAIQITTAWLCLRVAQTAFSQFYRGHHQLFIASVVDRAMAAFILMLVLALVFFGGATINLGDALEITSYALALVILFALVGSLYMYGFSLFFGEIDLKPVLKICTPLFASSVLILGLGEAHLWILAAYKGEEEVALYGAAFRLMTLVAMPVLIVKNTEQATVAELYAKKKYDRLQQVLRTGAAVAGAPACIVLIVLVLFAKEALQLVYGGYYAQGEDILVILLLAQTINVTLGTPSVLLNMAEFQAVVMRTAIVSSFIGVSVSLVTVDAYGGVGVALGLASGLILHKVLMFYACVTKLNTWTHMDISSLISLSGKAIQNFSKRK